MNQAGIGDGADRSRTTGLNLNLVIAERELCELRESRQVAEPTVGNLGMPKVESPDAVAEPIHEIVRAPHRQNPSRSERDVKLLGIAE